MLTYTIRQLEANGYVLSEITVEAPNYSSALRSLPGLAKGCHKIVVLNYHGEKAGEIGAQYWQQRIRK